MAKKRSDAGESLPIKPTMGPALDEYRLALNVVPRSWGLERRPSLQAVPRGLLHNGSAPEGTGSSSGGYGNATHKAWTIAETAISDGNQIAEGIDVEYVNGKLVCAYLSADMKFEVSFHSPVEPVFGRKLKYDYFASSVKSPSTPNTARTYHIASYWKKRIEPVFDSFAVTGHGTGAGTFFGFTYPNVFIESSFELIFGVNSNDILMWNADPLKLMCQPTYFKNSD